MPEVNEEALLKLIKITVFLIRQHRADAKNYEDLLNLWILHLKRIHWKNNCISETHRNATYLSANIISTFVKNVSEWMRDETMVIIRN